MPQVTLVDLVNSAPEFTPDMARDVGELMKKYVCLPAMLQHFLSSATADAISLKSASLEDPKGLADSLRLQGAIVARQNMVDMILSMAMEPPEEKEPDAPRERRTRNPPPRGRATAKKKTPAKKRK